MNRNPFSWRLVLGLAAWGLLLAMFLLGGIEYAYGRIGIPAGAMFGVIFGELAGSAINIPVAQLPGRGAAGAEEIRTFGVRYRLPVSPRGTTTTLAVNVGGAVIPAAVSVYLLIKDSIWWQAAVGVIFVAAIVT